MQKEYEKKAPCIYIDQRKLMQRNESREGGAYLQPAHEHYICCSHWTEKKRATLEEYKSIKLLEMSK